MDILKPELYEIGGRVYCNYNQSGGNHSTKHHGDNAYDSEEEDDYDSDERAAYDDYNDEPSCEAAGDPRIQRLGNGT